MVCIKDNKINHYRFLWILFWALFVSGMTAMIAGVCSGQPPVTGDEVVTEDGGGGVELFQNLRNGVGGEVGFVVDMGKAAVEGAKAAAAAIGNAFEAVGDVDMGLVSLTTMTKFGAIGGGSTLALGGIYTYFVDKYESDWFGKRDAEHYNIKHITRWLVVLVSCYVVGALCGGLYGALYGGGENKMKYAALWAWSMFAGLYTIQRLCMFGLWMWCKDDTKYNRVKNWGNETDTSNFCHHCGQHGKMTFCETCDVEHCSCQKNNCSAHARKKEEADREKEEKRLRNKEERRRKNEAATRAELEAKEKAARAAVEEMKELQKKLDRLQGRRTANQYTPQRSHKHSSRRTARPVRRRRHSSSGSQESKPLLGTPLYPRTRI